MCSQWRFLIYPAETGGYFDCKEFIKWMYFNLEHVFVFFFIWHDTFVLPRRQSIRLLRGLFFFFLFFKNPVAHEPKVLWTPGLMSAGRLLLLYFIFLSCDACWCWVRRANVTVVVGVSIGEKTGAATMWTASFTGYWHCCETLSELRANKRGHWYRCFFYGVFSVDHLQLW